MSGPTTYRGNCHCGAFVFEVTFKAPLTVYHECNCSICLKKGYGHAILTDGEELKIIKGSLDDLTSYTFGGGNYVHRFCPTCASPVLVTAGKPGPGANPSVNVRCLQGPLDLSKLEKKIFDGASIKPDYEPTPFTGTEPTGGPEDAEVYHGSCHCGAVRLALRNKPLEKLDREIATDCIIDCNCSICIRNGYIWIYPSRDQVNVEGSENLSHYEFNKHVNSKSFCKTCGVPMTNFGTEYTPEELAKLPELARAEASVERRKVLQGRRPVNLRVLNGMSLDRLGALPVQFLDGYASLKPDYVNP